MIVRGSSIKDGLVWLIESFAGASGSCHCFSLSEFDAPANDMLLGLASPEDRLWPIDERDYAPEASDHADGDNHREI